MGEDPCNRGSTGGPAGRDRISHAHAPSKTVAAANTKVDFITPQTSGAVGVFPLPACDRVPIIGKSCDAERIGRHLLHVQRATRLRYRRKMESIEHRVLKVTDLEDGQMKQVEVGPLKVLVARVAGKFHAVGGTCP